MKKLLFLTTLCLTANSWAIQPFKSGYYVELQGGANFKTSQLAHNQRVYSNVGYIGSVSLGMRTIRNIRYEFEFTYRENSLHKYYGNKAKGHTDTQAYMINVLYDFPTRYFIKPYFGGGVGYARQFFKGETILHVLREDKRSMAYQGIFGLSCPFDALDPLGFDIEGIIEYKFFNPRIKTSNDQSIEFGLRTYF